MRVFVTGATGFIGSAIVQELLGAGHTVVGLARSDKSAAALTAAGAEAFRGDLTDLDSLKRGAAEAEGVIHTAFSHDFMVSGDFSKFAESGKMEQRAIEALGEALHGTDRPLLITSGVALLSPGRVATENDQRDPAVASLPRDPDRVAAALAAQRVNAQVIRMSPSVHGDGDKGFVPTLIRVARKKGVSAYVGEGNNRWSAVHRLDAAVLYRLALEHGTAGAAYHAVADEGVPVREIAEVIGQHLNVPLVSQSPEEAAAHFGWFGAFIGLDCPASSQITQETLGWQPKQPGLIADLDHGTYFDAP